MGLGSREPLRKQYYLSILAKTDKQIDPHFKVQKRDIDSQQTINLKNVRDVSGYLSSITYSSYEWEGKVIPTIGLVLIEKDEKFKVETSLDASLARTLINTMLSCENFKGLFEIGLWKSKDGYPKMSIKVDGERLNWKYEYKGDLENLVYEVEDPKEEGKMVKVYKKLNAKLLEDWKALIPIVTAAARTNDNLKLVTLPADGVATTTVTPGAQVELKPGESAEKALFGDDAKKAADELKHPDQLGPNSDGDPGPDASFLDNTSSSNDDLPF